MNFRSYVNCEGTRIQTSHYYGQFHLIESNVNYKFTLSPKSRSVGIFKAILVKQVYVNYIVTCDFNQIPLILRKNVQILSGHASHMERK